jgi:hypothetical protein
MAQFSPDTIAFGDAPGWGTWLMGHYREHRQFVDIGFLASPAFFIPDWDLLSWDWANQRAITDWLNVHEKVHELLRSRTNVQGVDLSIVDFNNRGYFSLWIDTHAQEHADHRKALGLP